MSEVSIERFPKDGLFEIILVGKSNVGKSSFINSMLNRKSLARTSSQPGKTRTANFYIVNNDFYFVDMPGYGYAKVSKSQKNEFDKILKEYIKKRKTDFIVFMLIDFRHAPTQNDLLMYNFLRHSNVHPVFILTKEDKVKKSEKTKQLNVIKNSFHLTEDDAVFPYSIQDKKSSEQVWAFIDDILKG